MHQARLTFALIISIAFNLAILHAQPATTPDEKTVAFLKRFRSDFIKTMLDKNRSNIQGYYAGNMRLMPEFQKTIIGKGHALKYFEAFANRFDVREYNRDEIEILDLGSQVVEHGMFSMNMVLKSTNKEHELKGKYQDIWEKQPDGKLLLITQGWNYNHQVPFSEALRFAEVPSVNIALEPHLPVNSNISFELAALCRLMESAISQHDNKIWAQFYTDDGMFIYSFNPIYKGRKALDAFLEKHVNEMPIFEKLDIRNDRIDNLGVFVIEYASHVAIWRNGASSGVNTGKDVRIWRREKEGSLKILRSMAMYD
jgi:ketosteroid isomerase-like protein